MRHRRGIDLAGPRMPSLKRARLDWTRHDGGFIAWPEGREHPARYCRLAPHQKHGGNLSGTWTDSLNYDGQTDEGHAGTRQAASDSANWRWTRFIHELLEKEAAVHAEAAVRTRILAADRDRTISIRGAAA